MRRHDYAVDVLGGAKGTHYIGDYNDNSGTAMPHRRRVYPLGVDNRKVPEPLLIEIDIAQLRLRIDVSGCFKGEPDESRDPR